MQKLAVGGRRCPCCSCFEKPAKIPPRPSSSCSSDQGHVLRTVSRSSSRSPKRQSPARYKIGKGDVLECWIITPSSRSTSRQAHGRPSKHPSASKSPKRRSTSRNRRGKEDASVTYMCPKDVLANKTFVKMLKNKYNCLPINASSQELNGHSAPRETIYRVAPIKSKTDLEEGDLIIETHDHKFLKVLGPADRTEDEAAFAEIKKKASKVRMESDYYSSSSSESDSDHSCLQRWSRPRCRCHSGCRCTPKLVFHRTCPGRSASAEKPVCAICRAVINKS